MYHPVPQMGSLPFVKSFICIRKFYGFGNAWWLYRYLMSLIIATLSRVFQCEILLPGGNKIPVFLKGDANKSLVFNI